MVAAVSSQNTSLFYTPLTCDLVKEIAVKILKELTLSLSLGMIVSCFIGAPMGLSAIMGALLVQTAVSALFHFLNCSWLTAYNFALFTGFNTQLLIHESGHALGSILTFQKARPTIEIFPFQGGFTSFRRGPLTPFGKALGLDGSLRFTTLMGPALTLLVSSVLLMLGNILSKTHPTLSKYLTAWGVIDFSHHALYAYSALSSTSVQNDFVRLWGYGLHPVITLIGIIAIPIFCILLAKNCAKWR